MTGYHTATFAPATKSRDVNKLPVWARRKIEALEADLASKQKQMEQMLGDNLHTNNVLLPYFREDMHDQYLPRNQQVRFQLPQAEPRQSARPGYIEVHHTHGDKYTLDIHGSEPLWIECIAANCFKLRFRDR